MIKRLLQFTLDLFEPESVLPVPPERQPKVLPKSVISDKKPHLPLLIGEMTPLTLQQALPTVSFVHPRASRESLLDGVLVAYELKRGKRRTIGFSVGSEGLIVSAPKWVPLYEIDKAVLEKSAWILKKLKETRERHHRLESARIEWKDGCTIPYLGEQVILVLDPTHAFIGVGAELKNEACETLVGLSRQSLHVALPHSATADQIKDVVQAWLMRQSKQNFTSRLNHFAPTLNVQWRKLSLSNAGTRWGSASSDGSIRLNWRLVHFKQSIIDYVVVHELSHLRVMDHSPRFWDTVRAVVPDFADLRGQLKSEGVPRW